jgi:Dynein heavy chain, N-terminal region 2
VSWTCECQMHYRIPDPYAAVQVQDLIDGNQAFSTIEKSLSQYLESKKLLCPRFFFLANEEVLS